MIKSSFVSLFFSSNKLQILELSSSKKKVKAFTSVDLPGGLIVNHQVKDENALADILKNLWKKLGIKERSVGIVVPEFSTFTKNLILPKLDDSELDEAVRWQAQEYMPLPLSEMVLDWKIIGSSETEVQILAIAIKEEILSGYVNAAANAGLFPLVVETPSISLVRLTHTTSASMVIFGSFDEIILILTVGEKIITSSVISLENASEIGSTADRMKNHYSDLKIEKIFIGGMGMNDSLAKEIAEKVKIPVEKLSLKIGGLTESDIGKYLIPISLQYKNPAEPADTTTINLLPQPVVKKYQQKRFDLQLWGLLMLVTLMVLGSFVTSLGTYIYLVQAISANKGVVTTAVNTNSKNKDASNQIKLINQKSDKVAKVLSLSQSPQEVLNSIYEAKPEGITLTAYKIDLEKGTINLAGIATSRDDLIGFKGSLTKTGVFGQILLPLATFEIETNLDFDLSFVYLPVVNQNKVKK